MRHVKNGSFLHWDINRTSQHAVRLKKNTKKKLREVGPRRLSRWLVTYNWNINDVKGWGDSFMEYCAWHYTQQKTIRKKFCRYSNRVRSVNEFGISKYKVALFSRLGVIKDLKKY